MRTVIELLLGWFLEIGFVLLVVLVFAAIYGPLTSHPLYAAHPVAADPLLLVK